MSDLNYRHVARCPVCGEIFDTLVGPDIHIDGQVACMLLSEPRRAHMKSSPACDNSPLRVKGWVFDKPELVEE